VGGQSGEGIYKDTGIKYYWEGWERKSLGSGETGRNRKGWKELERLGKSGWVEERLPSRLSWKTTQPAFLTNMSSETLLMCQVARRIA